MGSHERAPVPSIDLVVVGPGERILLGRVAERWSDHGRYVWGLPGREVLFGEDLRSAAARSLHEEVGLALTSARFLSVNSNYGFGNHYLCVALLVEAAGALVNQRPDDWTAWDWFERSHLPERLFPSADRTLQAYLAGVASLDLVEEDR
jgi:ADP-ribose pyrophosphatase YjhB (NUDIX family)